MSNIARPYLFKNVARFLGWGCSSEVNHIICRRVCFLCRTPEEVECMSYHSAHINVTSFGKGVFTNIIKDVKMIKEVLNVLLSAFLRR